MKLIPLGIYGAYPQKNGGTSSYLIQSENTNIVLDFGSGALSRIQNYIDIADIDAIILTHFHADHFCDLLQLRYYIELNKIKNIKLFMPLSTNAFSEFFTAYDFEYIGKNAKIGDLDLEFYKMSHIDNTYGVKVIGDVTLSYTADTTINSNIDLLVKDSVACICDCAIFDEEKNENSKHMSCEDALKICDKYKSQCLMSHFLTSDMSKFKKIASEYNAIVLEENKTYEFIGP